MRCRQRLEPLLLQAFDLAPGEAFERDVGQRPAPPQRERLAVKSVSPLVVAGRGQLVAIGRHATKALGVQLVLSEPQEITRRTRGDQVVAEGLAKL